MVEHILKEFKEDGDVDLSRDRMAIRRVRKAVKKVVASTRSRRMWSRV